MEVRVEGDVCGFLHWDVEDFEKLYRPLIPLLKRKLGARDAEEVLSIFFYNPYVIRRVLRGVRFRGPYAEELNRFVETGEAPAGARLYVPYVEVGVEVDLGIYASPCLLLAVYSSPYNKKAWESWQRRMPQLQIPFPPPPDPHSYISAVFPRQALELYKELGFVGLANARNRRHNYRRAVYVAMWAHWATSRKMAHIDAEIYAAHNPATRPIYKVKPRRGGAESVGEAGPRSSPQEAETWRGGAAERIK